MTAFPFFPTRAEALDALAADLDLFAKMEPETLQKGACTFEVEYEDGKPIGYRILMGQTNGTHCDLGEMTEPSVIMDHARRAADEAWDADIENESLK